MKEEFEEAMELWPIETEGRDLTEEELCHLQIQTILNLLSEQIDEIEGKLDRLTYYGDQLSREDLENVRKNLKHIVKNYS